MKKILTIITLSILSLNAFSQEITLKDDTLRKDALNVYMDASDYVRKDIPYINYVRDIKDAGVYIITTTQRTGSGGLEFTYFFVGQAAYKGMSDTLTFVTSPDETQDETRIKEVKTLKMGLMRFVAKTPLSKYMDINFSEPLSETVSSDKWNSWVYKASCNGYLDGQQSYKSTNLNGNISAARVTKDWKINLSARYNYGIEKYDLGDKIITSTNTSKSINSLIVRSISEHWSYGGSAFFGSSSYSNTNLVASILPGIEFDLFPYSESTRRQLRLLYSIGYRYSVYTDTTVYDVTEEGHLLQSMNVAYEVIEKWGSIDVSLNYNNYLYDWSKNNLSLNAYLELRIAKGLSVFFYGGASIIHDQLGLVKGGATAEEVLLRQKELATQFNYYTSFGFTYTFGSIYNNVVNPRFGNGGGGGITISY